MGRPAARGGEDPRRDSHPPGAHRVPKHHTRHHHRSRPEDRPAPTEDSVAALVGAELGGAGVAPMGEAGLLVPGGGRRATLARVLVRAAPWLLLMGGSLFDAVLPTRFSAAPFFTGAPLVAAPFYPLRAVLIISVLSLIGVTVPTHQRGTLDDINGVTQLFTLLTAVVFAVLINRMVNRGYIMLTSARHIAAVAQRAVLPRPPEHLAGLDVAAHYEAAQAGASIGGDFYAAQDTPHGVRFVLGDVRGKGMGAVAAVGVVIGAFREAAEQETSLEGVAQRLDRALAREAALRTEPEDFEEFATAVLVEIPHGHGCVRIVNRGHPAPLLLHADGRLAELTAPVPALPLGMTDLGSWPDRAQEIALRPGTQLLLFTDGLSEARDHNGVFYDPAASLRGRVFDSPRALLSTLVTEVRRHTGDGGTDDLALLAVRRP